MFHFAVPFSAGIGALFQFSFDFSIYRQVFLVADGMLKACPEVHSDCTELYLHRHTDLFFEAKVGCAVSVVSAKKVKTIRFAKMIGTKWKYSQPKRMQKGYYDCSSLVWKAYCKMGKKIGGNYALVAADLAKWCKAHGKKITNAYTRNHIEKMKNNISGKHFYMIDSQITSIISPRLKHQIARI